ncbi:MAG: Asp-tRNA(Asn)/Glu-tRNA(Gln) amidotransferase subunit GatC [Parachlamydiaceae bacterium]|nr:Asp-tRNA(Asn)/Glu-tRNA(Gln) amidotransferase subunit GatC [Parachlamydiaceae bacterium]
MASFDRDTIKKLTKLSRIQCNEDEESQLLSDLQKILSYVELMNEVDTENVRPCTHVLEEMCNVERDDVVGEVMPREVFLANAPDKIGGMIRVPSIMKSRN